MSEKSPTINFPVRTCTLCGASTTSTSSINACGRCGAKDGLRPKHFLTKDGPEIDWAASHVTAQTRIADLEKELRILQEDATNRISAYEREKKHVTSTLETARSLALESLGKGTDGEKFQTEGSIAAYTYALRIVRGGVGPSVSENRPDSGGCNECEVMSPNHAPTCSRRRCCRAYYGHEAGCLHAQRLSEAPLATPDNALHALRKIACNTGPRPDWEVDPLVATIRSGFAGQDMDKATCTELCVDCRALPADAGPSDCICHWCLIRELSVENRAFKAGKRTDYPSAVAEILRIIDARIDALNEAHSVLTVTFDGQKRSNIQATLNELGKLADDIGKRWPGSDPCTDSATNGDSNG